MTSVKVKSIAQGFEVIKRAMLYYSDYVDSEIMGLGSRYDSSVKAPASFGGFKYGTLPDGIGVLVAYYARKNIKSGGAISYGAGYQWNKIKRSTREMRQRRKGERAAPLYDTGRLMRSITFSINPLLKTTEIIIGVPKRGDAGKYALFQEIGGVTAANSAIPSKVVPPRPFLMPAASFAMPEIQKLIQYAVKLGWLDASKKAVSFGMGMKGRSNFYSKSRSKP